MGVLIFVVFNSEAPFDAAKDVVESLPKNVDFSYLEEANHERFQPAEVAVVKGKTGEVAPNGVEKEVRKPVRGDKIGELKISGLNAEITNDAELFAEPRTNIYFDRDHLAHSV